MNAQTEKLLRKFYDILKLHEPQIVKVSPYDAEEFERRQKVRRETSRQLAQACKDNKLTFPNNVEIDISPIDW